MRSTATLTAIRWAAGLCGKADSILGRNSWANSWRVVQPSCVAKAQYGWAAAVAASWPGYLAKACSLILSGWAAAAVGQQQWGSGSSSRGSDSSIRAVVAAVSVEGSYPNTMLLVTLSL